jgi:hypothetical protein
MARHGRHIFRRGEGLCTVWLAMRVFGSPWRELQVLTRNLAMASEILAMASSAGHEISPWQVKFSPWQDQQVRTCIF